jgi:protein-tyrosine-phosphatase
MQGRIRKAAAKARRILFVCKGNICRSPFAEAATRVLAQHRLEVRSAGYCPAPDRPCPDRALAAAGEYGIDLSRHRSHLLDDAAAEWADMILLFDYDNEEALRARFPKTVVKSHYLGALDTVHALEIADPFSKDLDVFHATYRRIFELLEMHLLPGCSNAVH